MTVLQVEKKKSLKAVASFLVCPDRMELEFYVMIKKYTLYTQLDVVHMTK